jgi:hypothetical protein
MGPHCPSQCCFFWSGPHKNQEKIYVMRRAMFHHSWFRIYETVIYLIYYCTLTPPVPIGTKWYDILACSNRWIGNTCKRGRVYQWREFICRWKQMSHHQFTIHVHITQGGKGHRRGRVE